jgi:hypothetical protein
MERTSSPVRSEVLNLVAPENDTPLPPPITLLPPPVKPQHEPELRNANRVAHVEKVLGRSERLACELRERRATQDAWEKMTPRERNLHMLRNYIENFVEEHGTFAEIRDLIDRIEAEHIADQPQPDPSTKH